MEFVLAIFDCMCMPFIGLLRGGGQGGFAPSIKLVRCSKIEVADQQGVVNSRP